MIKKISLYTFIFFLFIISACSGNADKETTTDHLTIQTTLYPLEYIIDEIGGDAIQAETIYPPGVDPHTYEPTSKEITSIAKADAFVYLGAGMEAFADKAASALSKQDVELIEVGKDTSLFAHTNEKDDNHDHGNASHIDPHIWLDPLRMNDLADILFTELIKLDPENEAKFATNLTTFKDKMVSLNDEFDTTLKNKENKTILVTHAAYGYWERNYDIKQLSIRGLSTSDEPSQKQLADIARLAKELQIKYVIYGQNDANQTAEIIQSHINGEKLTLHNLEVLTDEDINNGSDYLSLMKDNLHVLDQATN